MTEFPLGQKIMNPLLLPAACWLFAGSLLASPLCLSQQAAASSRAQSVPPAVTAPGVSRAVAHPGRRTAAPQVVDRSKPETARDDSPAADAKKAAAGQPVCARTPRRDSEGPRPMVTGQRAG